MEAISSATTIPHRTLRNSSAEILRRVEAGETFNITNHGKVVAELGPPAQTTTMPLPDIRPARINDGFAGIERVESAISTEQALDELRGDR